jgi:arylsulfatase A-like enzyme
MTRTPSRALGALVLVAAALVPLLGQSAGAPRRNVVLFVADGLRHGSVNAEDTPALWRIRTEGVHFENSHSVYPTLTMANASSIATGHWLGDTGVFGNVLRTGYAMYDTGNFNHLPGSPVPFIESDQVLSDLDDHFAGSPLPFDTLLATARGHGYRTAAVGKLGPSAMQDVAELAPVNGQLPPPPPGLIIDDATGGGAGLALPPDLSYQMFLQGMPSAAPGRTNGYDATSPYSNSNAGTFSRAGTLRANLVQQDWFISVTTRFVLPSLSRDPATPFALLFWSRDPDGTQHNNGDSLGSLFPGINGPTSVAGVRNADRALQALLAWFDAHPAVRDNTDILVTSDHGFATISRSAIDRSGHVTTAESAKHDYVGASGSLDTPKGTLPPGFLALDLAYDLQMNVFDPDTHPSGSRLFKKLRVGSSANAVPMETWEHPSGGNALLGSDVRRPDGSDARVIIASNGGSDLIYVPDHDAGLLQTVIERVRTYDYVSGVFVDDSYGPISGTLPLGAINVGGSGKMPRPAAIVAFKVFYLNPQDLQTGVQVSDTDLQEGQGHHGGFGRECTFNNMAAVGPDFKRSFTDAAPVGNPDIAPTLAHLMGFDLPAGGQLRGRVMSEALTTGARGQAPAVKVLRSTPADGVQTVLVYREYGGIRYLDRGCFAAAGTPDADVCH